MSSRVVAFSVFVLLLVAYVGGYVALLSPGELVLLDGGSGLRARVPAYRVGGLVPRTIFGPALWVDQRVRPQYWDWEELPYGSECMSERSDPAPD